MSDLHNAVGAYVVDALDSSERDDFVSHLAVCASCSQEVMEFAETVAELSVLAPAAAPPPALRASLMSVIAEVRPLPPEMPAALPRRAMAAQEPTYASDIDLLGPAPSVAAPVSSGPTGSTLLDAPVDELAVRRANRRARVLSLAVAAAMVVALSLGGWAFSLHRDNQAQVAEAALESQLYTAADVKVSVTHIRNGASITFVSSKSLNKAMVATTGLPATSSDQRYQLWTVHGTAATPDALFEGGQTRTWFSGPITDATALAVTIEPTEGSQKPTSPIQAAAQL